MNHKEIYRNIKNYNLNNLSPCETFFLKFWWEEWRLRVCLDTAENWKLKTENWKYCSKIIFKYVNSIMRSIYSEKVVEKWILWVLWIVYGTHWCALFTRKSQQQRLQKEEKKTQMQLINVESKRHLSVCLDRNYPASAFWAFPFPSSSSSFFFF